MDRDGPDGGRPRRSGEDQPHGPAGPDRDRTVLRTAAAVLRAVIVAVLGAGLVRRSPAVVVNAALALAVTFVPAVLRRDRGVRLHPGLTLWITTAVLLHAVGMLGPYGSVWWWDHVTHVLSATVVAGAGYATARAFDLHYETVSLPPVFVAAFVLLFTLALGVVWEVLEFATRVLADAAGFEVVFVQFGLEDTMFDLLFDAVGAVLVTLFGTGPLSRVTSALLAALDTGGDRGGASDD